MGGGRAVQQCMKERCAETRTRFHKSEYFSHLVRTLNFSIKAMSLFVTPGTQKFSTLIIESVRQVFLGFI